MQMNLAYVVILLETYNPNIILRKMRDKSKFGIFLQNTWPAHLKAVKVTKKQGESEKLLQP